MRKSVFGILPCIFFGVCVCALCDSTPRGRRAVRTACLLPSLSSPSPAFLVSPPLGSLFFLGKASLPTSYLESWLLQSFSWVTNPSSASDSTLVHFISKVWWPSLALDTCPKDAMCLGCWCGALQGCQSSYHSGVLPVMFFPCGTRTLIQGLCTELYSPALFNVIFLFWEKVQLNCRVA